MKGNMKYRKKPVVIEAYQWMPRSLENQADWPQWLKDAFRKGVFGLRSLSSKIVSIETLEGPQRVSDYDWIIQGIKGELYPCKPDKFDMTYEPVD